LGATLRQRIVDGVGAGVVGVAVDGQRGVGVLGQGLRGGEALIEHTPYTPGTPGEYELRGPLTPEHLSAFTAALTAHYIMPISLKMEPKTLEDVFLDISGRDIR